MRRKKKKAAAKTVRSAPAKKAKKAGGKAKKAGGRSKSKELTAREAQVFDLIVREGLNNTEIADKLGITERSAKFHTSNVLRKMDTPDRLKLTVMFWQSGGKK